MMLGIILVFAIGYAFSWISKKIAFNESELIKFITYPITALIFTVINCGLLYVHPMFNILVCYSHFKEMFMPPETERGQEGYGKKYKRAGTYSILLCILFFILSVITRACFSTIYHLPIY